MELDTGMFICKVVIGVCIIVKIVLALIEENRKKKVISVSSRGIGTVDEDGNVHLDKITGFDIVKDVE
jgi:hypothetical protein